MNHDKDKDAFGQTETEKCSRYFERNIRDFVMVYNNYDNYYVFMIVIIINITFTKGRQRNNDIKRIVLMTSNIYTNKEK